MKLKLPEIVGWRSFYVIEDAFLAWGINELEPIGYDDEWQLENEHADRIFNSLSLEKQERIIVHIVSQRLES